jgi:hypothetical protein
MDIQPIQDYEMHRIEERTQTLLRLIKWPHKATFKREDESLIIDDTFVIESGTDTYKCLTGTRVRRVLQLSAIIYHPGTREDPPEEDYTEIGSASKEHWVANLLVKEIINLELHRAVESMSYEEDWA